jgi:hypothetical protein
MSASETGPMLLTIMSTSTKVGGPVDQNNFISIKVFISFDHFFFYFIIYRTPTSGLK